VNGETHGDIGGSGMNVARILIAGTSVALGFCAIARADDDPFPGSRTMERPVVVKRVIVLTGRGERVIYFRPAYPIHSLVQVNRSGYLRATPVQRRLEASASPAHENDDHASKTMRANRNHEGSQPEQQADRESKDSKGTKDNTSADARPEAKQPEDVGALDQLTVQAQKEEATRLAAPGGIESK
jgi:hypothetical protein